MRPGERLGLRTAITVEFSPDTGEREQRLLYSVPSPIRQISAAYVGRLPMD